MKDDDMNPLAEAFARLVLLLVKLAVYALPLKWCWNETLPLLFNGVGEITYLQAAMLMLLAELIFNKGDEI